MKTLKPIVLSTLLVAIVMILGRFVTFNEFSAYIVIESIITSILMSVVFYFFNDKLTKRTVKVLAKSMPDVKLNDDEQLVLTSGASHYKGLEAVGGKLVLTNKRLIFMSHKFNLQNHHQEFPVSEIKSVAKDDSKYKIFQLELADKQIHKFLVDSPSDWISAIPH